MQGVDKVRLVQFDRVGRECFSGIDNDKERGPLMARRLGSARAIARSGALLDVFARRLAHGLRGVWRILNSVDQILMLARSGATKNIHLHQHRGITGGGPRDDGQL